jgi:hypothetical protein
MELSPTIRPSYRLVKSDDDALLTKVSSHSHAITKKCPSPSPAKTTTPVLPEEEKKKSLFRLVSLDAEKVWWMFLFRDSFDGSEFKLLFDPASVPNPGIMGSLLLNNNYLGDYIKHLHRDPEDEEAINTIAEVGLVGDWCLFSDPEDDDCEDYKALEDPTRVILKLQNQIVVLTSPTD